MVSNHGTNTFRNLYNYLNFLKENLQLYLPNFHLHKGKMLFNSSDYINNLMASTWNIYSICSNFEEKEVETAFSFTAIGKDVE